jgi:hypothetical protein
MEIRWGRIFGALALILTTAGIIKLYKNAETASYKWNSMITWITMTFRDDPIKASLYVILFFQIAIVVLWILSRIVRWFRSQD